MLLAQTRLWGRQTPQHEQGNFQQRYNKMKLCPLLLSQPPLRNASSRRGRAHTQPFAAPFMAQRQQERAGAQTRVGVGRRELSDHLKTPLCCAAGNHSNHQRCFTLHFWSSQTSLLKLWNSQNMGVWSHLCLPCSTILCPTRRNPASLYPACVWHIRLSSQRQSAKTTCFGYCAKVWTQHSPTGQ